MARNIDDKIALDKMREYVEVVKDLSSNRSFRTFLRLFFESQGLFTNGGTGPNTHTTNALTTAFENGRLSSLQQLLDGLTQIVPDLYIILLKEQLHAAAADESRRATSRNRGRDSNSSPELGDELPGEDRD